ncbi:Ladinin-1 [Lonchura striata]|uniref:Ladinin-1 n=1 Tax=Lonchura striata TaxID=40157 RepID=A0A218USB5_9PASE|nr:Ladinin-1 [Lonchura striata domestica]
MNLQKSQTLLQLTSPSAAPSDGPAPEPSPFGSSPRSRKKRAKALSQGVLSVALERHASLRIPGSNSTIGEKLEKYNSAVQRSEGVKSSVPAQKSRLLSSEGVASKRDFFERSAPSKAEPAAPRKDSLKIPGSVTSRINLWISRAQEPAKEENSKVPPCVNLK